ncbi:MAG TPA: ATP-binding protein [Ktedonobacteraceae bacterium]
MALAPKTQSDIGPFRTIKQLSLSIGLRLSLAFMAVILLTGLIGILAIQQFSLLTHTTTELNSHDLPEAITLVHLRSLLYRQRDLERSLINGDSLSRDQSSPPTQQDATTLENDLSTIAPLNTPEPTPATQAGDGQSKQIQQLLSDLAVVLNDIAGDRQQLLAFERPDQSNVNIKDFSPVHKVANGVLKTSALSERIQALVTQAQFAQARTLDHRQQEPLRLSTIAAVTQLVTIEQGEAANLAAQAQQESGRSTLFVFALTTLCLLLSIVLAIIITRSLTRPLNMLLYTTEAIAAGDLNAESQVKRADEIGRLASAYDKMRLSLRTTIARLRQERQHTQAIIDASTDGIMLVDATYKIVTCNPAVEYLSGWRAHEAIGRRCWEVLGFQEPSVQAAQANEQLLALMEALQTRSEQSSFEMLITTRHGKPRWLAISCAPLPLDERDAPHALVIGLHDISQLKAVDQMKSDFVAMVSHELRAPLTTVSGSVETLHLLEPAADPESYQEVLGLLDQQTQRLRQVVEEVLQLTRFEAGRLPVQVQPVSLIHFLRSLVERINVEWSDGDHYIILHESAQEVPVWADGGLLEIVLRNLFENARKYTPQGTAVEVATERIEALGQVQVRVIDHGPGIPGDQLESIFERFSRGTQAAGTWTRGYGLGLYIARELMLAQNGSIRAEHRALGACFVLSLWMVTDDLCPLITEAEPGQVEEQEMGHLA